MFDSLTERLGNTLRGITGKAKLSEENIQETLREVRKALLEADVALSVVKQFIDQVRLRAIGQEVMQSLSPGQAFVKIVNDELVSVMGAEDNSLNLSVQPPAVIMMAGLQGAGKTTSTAKLALWTPLQRGSLRLHCGPELCTGPREGRRAQCARAPRAAGGRLCRCQDDEIDRAGLPSRHKRRRGRSSSCPRAAAAVR